MKNDRERNSWRGMIERCYYKNGDHYYLYGGKGITVCDRWRDSFSNFLADMGKCPSGLTLDRINGKGNYTPENCRWASRKVQARNRPDFVVMLSLGGETKHLTDWAKFLGIGTPTLHRRIHVLGWPLKDALTLRKMTKWSRKKKTQ